MYNKSRKYILFSLLMCELVSVFLTYKSYGNKTLDKVTEENKVDKQQFAMYVQKEKGSQDYEVLTADSFPDKLKYTLNIDRSECQDNEGIKLENNDGVISTDGNGKITVTSDKTIYCTFYFDLEKNAPTITEFHIGNHLGEEYTNQQQIGFHIEWIDDDIEKYCLTTESSSTNCAWQDKGVTTIAVDDNHKVDGTTNLGTDKTYTYYAYIKDLAGNESAGKNDQITLDTNPPSQPIISSVTGTKASDTPNPLSGYTHVVAVTVSGNWSDDDVEYYCLSNTNSSDSCSWMKISEKKITSVNHNIQNSQGQKTVYLYTKDKAGNISPVSEGKTIYLDTTNPTQGDPTAESITENGFVVKVVNPADNGSGLYQYCFGESSNNLQCGASQSKTYNNKAAGSTTTIYTQVKDKSGRVSSIKSVPVTTLNPKTGDKIIEKKPAGLGTDTSTGMRRFQGQQGSVNNYICFGTTSKCESQSDNMYRIIGIEDNTGRLKIMKETSIGGHAWHSDRKADINWSSSDIKSWLNGEGFLSNTTYVPAGWTNKIDTTTWKYGDIQYTESNQAATAVYNKEAGWTDKVDAKIGLIYLSDYYLSLSNTANCNYNSSTYSQCEKSWMNQSQNGGSDVYQWTMSRYGYYSIQAHYSAWYVFATGKADFAAVSQGTHGVRPVFYLKSIVKITGGTGAKTDPFLIN